MSSIVENMIQNNSSFNLYFKYFDWFVYEETIALVSIPYDLNK
jgi:hypothetical protein